MLPDTPVSEPRSSNVDISFCPDESNTSVSTWFRGPGSDQWDALLDEVERFREHLSKKEAALKTSLVHLMTKNSAFQMTPSTLLSQKACVVSIE